MTTTLNLPGPGGDESSEPHRQQRGKAGPQRAKSAIPDEAACLRGIAQLAGLIALGILKPAQANAIRASFREILQHHQKSQTRAQQPALSNGDVLELARENPAILSLLAPLLTDEQISLAMNPDESDFHE